MSKDICELFSVPGIQWFTKEAKDMNEGGVSSSQRVIMNPRNADVLFHPVL